MIKMFDKTLLKFILVGIVNTVTGAGVMFLLYNLFGVSYWISSAANYIVGAAVSFFLNKYFTFKNTERSFKQIIKFIITVAVCYVISYGIAKPLALKLFANLPTKICENIAMLIGMCLYFVLNYLGQRLFAFKTAD